jgi:SAM-dependent methyltransferase
MSSPRELRDYRQSHLAPEKGASYAESFVKDPSKAMVWRYEQRILGKIVSQLPARVVSHLDFACGTGRILAHLELFERISSIGVDISESMLDVARNYVKRSQILQGDVTRDDVLGNKRFELITAFRFFPNAQDELRKDAMAVLAAHLAPAGVLIFNNHKNLTFPANRLKRQLGRGFTRGMTLREAHALVMATGLVVERVYHFGVIPTPTRYAFFVRRLLEGCERLLSHCAVFRSCALNHIYVCRHIGCQTHNQQPLS